MKLVLTGGGTGGHVYPALAIAEALRDDPGLAPLDVLYIGTRERIEATIVPAAGLPIAYVHAAPLARRPSPALARTLFANARGFVEALAILHRFKPDGAIATGGYVAFPVVAALRAVRLLGRTRARIALFEPNAVAGLTNRVVAPLVDEVWLGHAPARGANAKEVVVGMPVRASFARPLAAEVARRRLGLDPARATVVVMGGSQGARSLNDAVAALLEDDLLPDVQFLLVTGDGERERVAIRTARAVARGALHLAGYLDDPRAAYAAADVMVARSGASTLGELAATGTPAVLVPYPYATADHQTHNAAAYARSGAARIVADAELDAVRLARELATALQPAALAEMRAAARGGTTTDPAAAIRARVKRWSSANRSYP